MTVSRFPPIAEQATSIIGLTAARVLFGSSTGGIAQSTGLVWDDTNKRLGLNTTSPTHTININDAVNSFTAISLYNANASANNRNWVLMSNLSAFGDFAIRVSTAKDGNPVSAGATVIYASPAGAITVGALTAGVTIGNASSSVGFIGATPAARQTSGADLTNSVTSGGTSDTIANYTDLTTYATDAAAIRNNIYQLSRKLKQVNDALRLYGLLT